jgi:hypothetical protein
MKIFRWQNEFLFAGKCFNDHVIRVTIERHIMSLLRLYTRVLQLLGKEVRLGWILAGGNVLLAAAQFAEPVLFGRIVDVLSGNSPTGAYGPASPSSACCPAMPPPPRWRRLHQPRPGRCWRPGWLSACSPSAAAR